MKKKGPELRQQYLAEQAEEYARKLNTTAEKALKAILKTDESKATYSQIRGIIGLKRELSPLTQIEIDDPNDSDCHITLTTKNELEHALTLRNQKHARQSLHTPFAAIPSLAKTIDPHNSDNNINDIMQGTFQYLPEMSNSLTHIEMEWVNELKKKIEHDIDLTITVQDFITFFKKHKERTASSPSGQHMGHYKVIAELAEQGNKVLAQIIVTIIKISVMTSRPLRQWQRSAQIMLEKGKGKYIENLRIIQLCEADLNFTLNIIWGSRLARNAMKHNALDKSQYALPGSTCNSAIWNKVLFCDLLCQSLTPEIMTDYEAMAAFDRVLHALSIITCQRLGLPVSACHFMYNLLQNMEFYLITGFGPSLTSFRNNEDPVQTGQGMLQGSSSAAPVYNICPDVSLTTYRRLAQGATFIHPINGNPITDSATQYVDDKTDLLNSIGADIRNSPHLSTRDRETLFNTATENSNEWASLLWILGGNLNVSKCFYYYLQPKLNQSSGSSKYHQS